MTPCHLMTTMHILKAGEEDTQDEANVHWNRMGSFPLHLTR